MATSPDPVDVFTEMGMIVLFYSFAVLAFALAFVEMVVDPAWSPIPIVESAGGTSAFPFGYGFWGDFVVGFCLVLAIILPFIVAPVVIFAAEDVVVRLVGVGQGIVGWFDADVAYQRACDKLPGDDYRDVSDIVGPTDDETDDGESKATAEVEVDIETEGVGPGKWKGIQ